MERTRQRCVVEGLEVVLERQQPVSRRPRKLVDRGEARWVVLACSEPPEGRAQWVMQLLGERLMELDIVDLISAETVRCTLTKTL